MTSLASSKMEATTTALPGSVWAMTASRPEDWTPQTPPVMMLLRSTAWAITARLMLDRKAMSMRRQIFSTAWW